MPKIQINERDLSWYYRQREPGQLVVLMPGVSIWGPVFTADKNQYPILLTEENFTRVLGDNPVHFNEDFSYHMAMSYIKAGIDVYFLRLDPGFKPTDTASTSTGTSVAGVYTCTITTKAKAGDKLKVNDVTLTAGSESWSLSTDTPEGNAAAIAAALTASTDASIKNYTWTAEDAVITATEKSGHEGKLGLPAFTVTKVESGTLAVEVATTTAGVTPQTNLVFTAKYPGSLGGRLSVKTWGAGNIRNIRVYLDRSTLVEDLICDFSDVYSSYYYENVNRNTQFIEVSIGSGGYKSDGGNIENFKDLYFSSDLPAGKTYDELTPEELKDMKKKMVLHDEVHKIENGSPKVVDGKYVFDRENIVNALQDALHDSTTQKPTALFNDLKDPLIYNFGVIVDGGYNDCPDVAEVISKVDTYFTTLAKERMDTIYLVSGTEGMTPDDFFAYCGLPSDYPETQTFTFDTSFAAAFGPWCYTRLLSNGATRCLPGYYPFLVAWGQSMSNGNPIWLAPAGIKRASLGDIVKDTKYFVGSGVVDMWQNQEFVTERGGTWKVNPICKLKQYGFVVYGNSTLLKNFHNGATSMLQSFSTRVMVNLIKTRAFDISLTLQFDQLSKELFGEFKTMMGVFLDQLRRSEALYDYKIIADLSELTLDDLNNHTVPIKILISPTPTAENFVINLEISKAGITFSDESPESLEFVAE